jgi:bifunctional non-homologous end joining protein LigD
VLWPKAKFTKAEAIDYYARIAEVMLPHLKDRPLTRVRFPDGVDSQRFFEKRAPKHTPDWVKTAPIEMGTAGTIDFILANDRATLIWLAQLAGLELHPSLALSKKPERPTVLAFDLDPGEPATAVECAQFSLRLRDLFTILVLE